MGWTEYVMVNKVPRYFRTVQAEKYLQALNATMLLSNKTFKGSRPEKTRTNTDTYVELEKSSQAMEFNSGLAEELLKDKPNKVLKRPYKNRTSSTIPCRVKRFHKATAKSRTTTFQVSQKENTDKTSKNSTNS